MPQEIAAMYRLRVFILLLMMLSAASCASKKVKETELSKQKETSSQHLPSGDQPQLINIANLYDKFSPRQSGFDDLFRRNLPDTAYRQYAELLEGKLKFHRKSARVFATKLLSKQKVSKRRRGARKEWTLGKSRKAKLAGFYRFFKHPHSINEYQVSYRTTPFNDKGVTDKKPKKTISTEQRYVLYFYKARGGDKVYLIDPDIFIESVL